MKIATIYRNTCLVLGMMFMVGSFSNVQAQTKPVLDTEFVFFIDGANVEIPTLDGTVTTDPLNPTSDNRVFKINFSGWGESGFRWTNGDRATSGVDMSAFTGTNYGETDTLYMRVMSDPLNLGKNQFIALLDTDTGLNEETDNLSFRLWWGMPAWMHDGQWHDVAIPLPPATFAGLDSAKAGKNLDGSDLSVTVDSLFDNWAYAGAWSNPGGGVFGGPGDNAFTEFDWESVKYVGVQYDYAEGGGPIHFDYMTIGVEPSRLAELNAAPDAVAAVDVVSDGGVNTLSWGAVTGAAAYNVYFSESAITNTTDSTVISLGSVSADSARTLDHKIVAPHQSLATDYTAYYAVTATSNLGAESTSTTTSNTATAAVAPNYATELSTEAINAVLDALEAGTVPEAATLAGFFPDAYAPFTMTSASPIMNGAAPASNDDLSAKFWMGYGSSGNELIIYAEVTDDALVFNADDGTTGATGAASGSWDYDSWELNIGNYSPASFVIGSTHDGMKRGAEPDYQFRGGALVTDTGLRGYVYENFRIIDEVPNALTTVDTSDTGYRALTVINTAQLAGGGTETVADDAAFAFPSSDEVKTYPLNFMLNDNETAGREHQTGWSARTANGNAYQDPTQWSTVAFVGANMVVSNEDEFVTQPSTFSLDQNYPNPFNPSTNIKFNLQGATNVTLEVFNVLGQKVATLVNNEKLAAGSHTKVFNAGNLASGVYLYRLSTASSFVQTRRMLLIK